MIRTSKNAVLSLLSVLALACGGNGGKSGSGVNPSKALGDATSQEVDELCGWFNDKARVVPTGAQVCRYEAVLNSDSRSECRDLVQSCIPDDDLAGSDNDECPFSQGSFSGCQTSVADFEDCLRRAAANTRSVFNNVSCDNPAAADELELPTACKAILQRCPAVFRDPDGGDVDGDTFTCQDGTEIRADFFCDGFDDCSNGEDERCSGGGGDDDGGPDGGSDGGFVCDSGDDIDDSYVCDTYQDCAGGEDELDCGDDPTPGGSFECKEGKSISKDFVCDGTRDCDAGEDEAKCDGGFVCKDGFDISDQWKCDETADCDGGEDELDC